MLNPLKWLETAGMVALAAIVAGGIGFMFGASYERNKQAADQAEATQQQNQLGNEAADEMRNLPDECLSAFLADRVLPDHCP